MDKSMFIIKKQKKKFLKKKIFGTWQKYIDLAWLFSWKPFCCPKFVERTLNRGWDTVDWRYIINKQKNFFFFWKENFFFEKIFWPTQKIFGPSRLDPSHLSAHFHPDSIYTIPENMSGRHLDGPDFYNKVKVKLIIQQHWTMLRDSNINLNKQ